MAKAYLQLDDSDAGQNMPAVVRLGGDWTITDLVILDRQSQALTDSFAPRGGGGGALTFDFADLGRLDTAGAWIIYRTTEQLQAKGFDIAPAALSDRHAPMLEQVVSQTDTPPSVLPATNPIKTILGSLGENTVEVMSEARDITGFVGQIVVGILRTIIAPRRLRLTALMAHIEKVGLNALPIVGLISLLIGVVLAYQGAIQLQRFGAEIFVVNLIGVSVLRELGILLTAIVVAGRSGSAFAAEIGSMKLHEEIDAMRTLGLDPMDVLILPRVLALVIALPLLAFFADMLGLLGGGLMSWLVLDISPAIFINRLGDAVGIWSFYVGLIKAPVFGFLIALVGCFEGLKVSGGAESVGLRTTRAVVAAIFLVIVADAVFSIFFATIGI